MPGTMIKSTEVLLLLLLHHGLMVEKFSSLHGFKLRLRKELFQKEQFDQMKTNYHYKSDRKV
tara:strand:+ start:1229 stop:1414 length:186 start_codon:yes stop_codon:yes gene_type:complete